MAIIKVDQFVAGAPVDTSDWAGHSAHIVAFINQVNNQQWHLTNPFNTTEPALAQGAYINHGATLYVVDTAEAISGSPDDGDVYVKLSVSGDNLVASYITDISGYSWNHAENNLYNAGDIVLPYRIVKSGTDWGKRRLVRQDVALYGDAEIDGTLDVTGALSAPTVNTGHGSNNLYPMNQGVRTTDAVTFSTVNTGQGNNDLYAMNQDVRTTDSMTFVGLTLTGAMLPRSNPTLGSQSIAKESYHTPTRGLYNSSWIDSNRGSVVSYGRGGDGPYSGTTDTRVYNNLSSDRTWYYAKF